MRLIGLLLAGFGAMIAWYLGIKGEDPATLRKQVFAFFQISDPGAVLPAANTVPQAAVATVYNGTASLADLTRAQPSWSAAGSGSGHPTP